MWVPLETEPFDVHRGWTPTKQAVLDVLDGKSATEQFTTADVAKRVEQKKRYVRNALKDFAAGGYLTRDKVGQLDVWRDDGTNAIDRVFLPTLPTVEYDQPDTEHEVADGDARDFIPGEQSDGAIHAADALVSD